MSAPEEEPIDPQSLELENLARLAMQEIETVEEIVRPDDPILSLQIDGTWYRIPQSIQNAYESSELTEAQYMTVAMIETAAQNFHTMHGIDIDESRKLASAAYLEKRIERTNPTAEHEAGLPNRHIRRAAIAKDRHRKR